MTRLPNDLQLPHPTIALITGPSGCGKSTTLPILATAAEIGPTRAKPTADRTKAIIDAWDIPPEQAIRRLSVGGLADPFSWTRTRDELSDGQRARFDLIDLIEGTDGLIVIDEWLATLDRLTARAVAWSAGKALRAAHRSAILITSQTDLDLDLAPDLHVRVGWEEEPTLTWKTGARPTPTLMQEITYRRGDRRDWTGLRRLHYAAGDPATVHSYHVLEHPALDHPAAVAVLSYPDLHSAGRNLATADAYNLSRDREAAKRLNREVLRLSRIVVAPELRSCGVARRLIAEMLPRLTVRYVECSTAMGRYTAFLTAAGFREIPQAPAACEAELQDMAVQLGIPPHVQLHAPHLETWAKKQSVRRQRRIRATVWWHFHHFVLHRRTRAQRPKKVPDHTDARWPEAWRLACNRLTERPAYFIVGPLAGDDAHTQEARPCPEPGPTTKLAGTPDSAANPTTRPTSAKAPASASGVKDGTPPTRSFGRDWTLADVAPDEAERPRPRATPQGV